MTYLFFLIDFWKWYTFAGKTATNNAIIPQAANEEVRVIHNPIPSNISTTPTILFINAGLGTQGGVILRKNFGFLK